MEAPRTEDRPNMLFGVLQGRDPTPITARHGRLIPGEAFSRQELVTLKRLARTTNTLRLTPIPSRKQLSRISVKPETGCWELPVIEDRNGLARYGSLRVAGVELGQSSLAHRVMFVVFHGVKALPNGPQDYLDHLCENKACCYPRHVEPVTAGTNTLRARIPYVEGQEVLNFEEELRDVSE